jgi:fructokinase
MILVAGESLIDLIVGPDDGVHASPGGGPFNAARTIARLGQPTRFLGRFSADPFGQILSGKLARDGVELAVPGRVAEPTALAIVALGGQGVPEYWFHVTQTAGFVLDQPTAQRALQADVTAVHVGSLGLVVDPMASELERLIQRLSPGPAPPSPGPDRHPEDQHRGPVLPGARLRYRGRRANPARLGCPLRPRHRRARLDSRVHRP